MHEIALCEDVLDAVERHAAGRRVRGIRVRVGTLHRVVGEAFDQGFALVSEGTVAEGAKVDVVVIPVSVTCGRCGEQRQSNELVAFCPACGADEVTLEGGDELVLESLELDGGT